MSAVSVPERTAADLLTIEEADAWFEYLHVTRDHGLRYEEVEPWAWSRLAQRLRAITARRKRLK